MTAWEFQRKRQSDLREYLIAFEPSHMMTVNYVAPLGGSRGTREQMIVSHLRRWNREVLETIYGRKFASRNQDDAFAFAAFIETGVLYQKDHVHLLVRVPASKREQFGAIAARKWNPVEKSNGGTVKRLGMDIRIDHIFDVAGAVRYCSKSIVAHPDRMWFSFEFRRA